MSVKILVAERDILRLDNKHLKQRIQRLEEALDRIIEIRNSAAGAGQYVTLDLIKSVATKAKEAKP